jgi:hypothetical protein
MRRDRCRSAISAGALAILVTSCGGAVSDEYVIENNPGAVEHIEGSELSRVSLTEQAMERLDVRTTEVDESRSGVVVPQAAVFVDPDGRWWVYTNPEPFVFVRHEIEIERERGRRVFLSSGPRAGAEVVVVGVAELYGIEAEVSH